MLKPVTIEGYDAAHTDACEQVLVTLLRGMGPWKESVFLVGGLTPRYLVKDRPPKIPAHAGTTDVDIVVDLKVLIDTEAYRTLEENLHNMGFVRGTNNKGEKISWRWQVKADNGDVMLLELLVDDPEMGARVGPLPTDGNVSAVNIPHASIVLDMHDVVEVSATLLGDNGIAREAIRHANLVSFTCLKAFALEHRNERKDAHDLVYCLRYTHADLAVTAAKFRETLNGKHAEVVRRALEILRVRFASDDHAEGHTKDGPVAAAKFELGDNRETREARALVQRDASTLVERLLALI
jgi:hypothetical protein